MEVYASVLPCVSSSLHIVVPWLQTLVLHTAHCLGKAVPRVFRESKRNQLKWPGYVKHAVESVDYMTHFNFVPFLFCVYLLVFLPSMDRNMSDIVYKLVPGLQKSKSKKSSSF